MVKDFIDEMGLIIQLVWYSICDGWCDFFRRCDFFFK